VDSRHAGRIDSHATDKPIKTFICAGQSNMVGWGDSTKLSDDLRKGNDRVLMFEDGKWQPLRPFEPANGAQKRVGLTEFHLGISCPRFSTPQFKQVALTVHSLRRFSTIVPTFRWDLMLVCFPPAAPAFSRAAHPDANGLIRKCRHSESHFSKG
jgi:hypothetical protein